MTYTLHTIKFIHLNCIIMCALTNVYSLVTTTRVKTQNISITQKTSLVSLYSISFSLLLTTSSALPYGNHWCLFYLYNFVLSRMLNKWNHPICSFFSVTFSLNIFLRFICVVICISSWVLFIADQCSILWVYRSLFIQSLVVGHFIVASFFLL